MSRFWAVLGLIVLFQGGGAGFAYAQQKRNEPVLPVAIEELRANGAQMKYLGRDLGFDGWIAVKDGQEQYFYVTPDGSAFFLGVMFNKNGRAVTYDQMKRLQGKEDPVFQDLMNAPSQTSAQALVEAAPPPTVIDRPPASSLSEQLMADVQAGHAFTMGQTGPAQISIFVDPLCPHCKDMLKLLKPAVDAGRVQIRVLMVGALAPQSHGVARAILDSPNPAVALSALVAGEMPKVPAGADVSDARLDGNLALLQKWKFEATPVTVYRAKDGMVKLVQGVATSADAILTDLP